MGKVGESMACGILKLRCQNYKIRLGKKSRLLAGREKQKAAKTKSCFNYYDTSRTKYYS